MNLDAIPPAPRVPSGNARDLVLGFGPGGKVMLLVATLWTLLGGGLALLLAGDVYKDLAILARSDLQRGEVIDSHVRTDIHINRTHPSEVRFRYGDRTATSVSMGNFYRPGQSVEVEVARMNPDWARIRDTTASLTGSFAFFMWLFPCAGAFILWMLVRQRSNRRRAFRDGRPATARVVYAGLDPRMKVNGGRPFKIEYAFPAHEERYKGSISSLDADGLRALLHDGFLTILYDPANPRRSVPWIPE